MVETILAGEELSTPPTQEFQAEPMTLDFQAGSEPVPEPSTFAFVGVTLGLVVLARVNGVSMLVSLLASSGNNRKCLPRLHRCPAVSRLASSDRPPLS